MLLSFSYIFFSKGLQTLHWYADYKHRLLFNQPWLSLESIPNSFPVSIAGIKRKEDKIHLPEVAHNLRSPI